MELDGATCRASPPSPSDDEDELYWNLGFVEPVTDSSTLLRHRFPSKVGGRPAWLDPVHIPTSALLCPTTQHTLQFLLQLYAPLEDTPHAFHRTVYLFISPRGGQLDHPGHAVALRTQLPRDNVWYPPHPPSERLPPSLDAALHDAALRCDPWQAVHHERPQAAPPNVPAPTKVLTLLPERMLDVREEVLDDEEEEQHAFMEGVADGDDDNEDGVSAAAMDSVEVMLSPEQRHFAEFATRVAPDPDQVVRYCFQPGAAPLTPLLQPPPPTTIPPCSSCGAPRRFEFQVMPQLISVLGIDASDPNALDFGTIAVYSCQASCTGTGYVQEWVWVQPPDQGPVEQPYVRT